MNNELFVLRCTQCGEEIYIPNKKGNTEIEGIEIFLEMNDNIRIECDCGNKIII
jgi:DNA-directed RNA polymerase subunit RPC12/RpoP